jgi:hypothetical protein
MRKLRLFKTIVVLKPRISEYSKLHLKPAKHDPPLKSSAKPPKK